MTHYLCSNNNLTINLAIWIIYLGTNSDIGFWVHFLTGLKKKFQKQIADKIGKVLSCLIAFFLPYRYEDY